MADIPGIRVTDTIVPTSTADTFPTHEDVYGRGGLVALAAGQSRSDIPTPRLKVGMLVREGATTYRLTSVSPVTWSALPDELDLADAAAQAIADAASAADAAATAGDTANTALATSSSAASNASAALAAAEAAVGAADSFPVADFRGTISALSQDPGSAASSSGKWWTSSVAGTMSHGNAGSVVVTVGGRILSDGAAWIAYPQAPAYLPPGSVVRAKLATADQVAISDAESLADEFLAQTTHSQGPATPGAGDAGGTEGSTRLHGTAVVASGLLTEVRFYCGVAGDSEIRIYSRAGAAFTPVAAIAVAVPSPGLYTVPLARPVEAGQYIGFFSPSARIQQDNGVGGESIWIYYGDATTTQTFTSFASIQLQLGWSIREISAKLPDGVGVERARLDDSSRTSLARADQLHTALIQVVETDEGIRSPEYEVETSLLTTRIYGAPISVSGTITQVLLYANNAGSLDLRVYSKSGSIFTLVSSVAAPVSEGANTIDGLSIAVTAGQYLGVYAETAGLGQVNDGTGAGIWTYGGDADPSATFANFPTVKPQLGWTVSSDSLVIPETAAPLRAPFVEVVQTEGACSIYVPSASGAKCVEYVLERQSDAPTHMDVWRIRRAYLVTRLSQYTFSRNLLSGENVCDEGAWEFATKVVGSADFVGTYHGYEEFEAAYLVSDGLPVADAPANRTVSEFALVQRSVVYQRGTTTPLAYRTMRLRFGAAGVACEQRIEWAVDASLEYGYVAMCPIRRSTVGGAEITGQGYVAPACAVQDVGASGFTVVIGTAGADEARVWGETSGVAAWQRLEELSPDDHLRAFISNSPTYNKLYFDAGYGATVQAGDVWKVRCTAAVTIN